MSTLHSTLAAARARFVLALAPMLLLAACGGGGGSGGTPAPVFGAVIITSANQLAVAASALDTATNIEAARSGTTLVTGVQVASGFGGAATLRLESAARTLLGHLRSAPALATGATIDRVDTCSLGGTIRVTGTIAGTEGVAAGDAVTVIASDCTELVDGVATTMNGTLSITVTAGSYDSANIVYPAHVVLQLQATAFSMRTASATVVADGDALVDLTETGATTGTVVVSGAALTTTTTSGGFTRTATLQDYRQAVTFNGSTLTTDVTAHVEASTDLLGRVSYDVSTPTPLTASDTAFTGGSLLVTGNRSALLLTVTGSNTFALDLDIDGDGLVDFTTSATLADLEDRL